MQGFFKSRLFELVKRYAPLLRRRSLARQDDEIWSFMGRTDSILWFKGNRVKPKAVLHISLSLKSGAGIDQVDLPRPTRQKGNWC